MILRPFSSSFLILSLTFALQALLVRHESHLAEAEAERLKMAATIDKLEDDKRELEQSNANIIAENRELLDQLENMNSQVCVSESEIQALAATLQSTQMELQRLNVLADRAAELETQLINIETEHAGLQSQFFNSQDQNRTAVQRWKKAEGTIAYLHEQIDKIEKEAREERERHMEVLGRLERRRAVERELENAASRLKGAAAAKSIGNDTQGSNVVSHFVRDILQDNAHLQMGVVELREMLIGSNAEVESLREQLHLHQPVEAEASTLNTELGAAESFAFEPIPELHVHHHYHQPEKTIKRPKKKRAALTSGYITHSGVSTPRQQCIREWRSSTSSANTILSQTSVTVTSNRWSTQSSQTGSSFVSSSRPSSPYKSSSVFDPIDGVFESRPTSPEMSLIGTSPPPPAKGNPQPSMTLLASYRSVSTPAPLQFPSANTSQKTCDAEVIRDKSALEASFQEQDLLPSPHETIPEEVETDDGSLSPGASISSFTKPRHRRAASHESLFSLAGGSTRPLRPQLSQNFDLTGRGFNPVTTTFSPISASFVAEPSISHATATARNITLRPNKKQESTDSARWLLSQAGGTPPSRAPPKKTVSGWAWGKWGKMPLPASAAQTTPLNPLEAALRSPGVNQAGFIKGLGPPKSAPVDIEPKRVDESLLRDAIAG